MSVHQPGKPGIGDVDSVFGRTGEVVAVTGDYTAAQVIAAKAVVASMLGSGAAAAGTVARSDGAGAVTYILPAGDVGGQIGALAIGAKKVLAAMLGSGAAGAGLLATANGSGGVTYLAPALTGGQAAIANLNLGTLTLLTDVITSLGTLQTSYNTLLSELRAAGVILT